MSVFKLVSELVHPWLQSRLCEAHDPSDNHIDWWDLPHLFTESDRAYSLLTLMLILTIVSVVGVIWRLTSVHSKEV